jgi:hypothetical protein
MARNDKAVYMTIDTIEWDEIIVLTGGGGIQSTPSSSPFLWTVFFKIDGSSISITDGGMVMGNATFTFSDGDHGDLEVGSVNPGAVIKVPDTLNFFSASLEPIPLPQSLQSVVNMVDEPALFGLAVVLLNDGGHISAGGIAAGHAKLNSLVQQAVSDLLQEAGSQLSPPTQAEINAEIQSLNISGKISDAVQNAQNFWENLWALTGSDSEIGHAVTFFSQDDFPPGSESQTWSAEIDSQDFGNWKINGSVTCSDQCPAATGAAILAPFFNAFGKDDKAQGPQPESLRIDLPSLLSLMRDFRDKKNLLKQTQFSSWWELAKKYSPEFGVILSTSNDAKERLINLLKFLKPHLENDDKKISPEFLQALESLFQSLSRRASPKFRKEIHSVTKILPAFHLKTLNESLHFLSINKIEP